MANCLVLIDIQYGIPCTVITNCCASSQSQENHEAGLRILETCIGTNQLKESEELE